MTEYRIFGENICNIRKHCDLTVTALAQKAKYNRQGITKLENGDGDISYETALKLAKALNVDFPSLFFRISDISEISNYIETDYLNIFIENIRRILKEKSKTQYSITALTGMDAGDFNRVLTRKAIPRISMLERIAGAFGKNLADLFVRGEVIE